jgi:hypothetical protein
VTQKKKGLMISTKGLMGKSPKFAPHFGEKKVLGCHF